jgi:hypothetical protein
MRRNPSLRPNACRPNAARQQRRAAIPCVEFLITQSLGSQQLVFQRDDKQSSCIAITRRRLQNGEQRI